MVSLVWRRQELELESFIVYLPKSGADAPSSRGEKHGTYSTLSLDAISYSNFSFSFSQMRSVTATMLRFYRSTSTMMTSASIVNAEA